MLVSKGNIRQFVRCVVIHNEPSWAGEAAALLAEEWKHSHAELNRSLQSMLEDGRNTLPCHLALVIEHRGVLFVQGNSSLPKECNVPVLVGHVKLSKADGRTDGPSCIMYSLVVNKDFRGLGIGRMLTEAAEVFALSLKCSFMYLSTNDQVGFYEHLGYKQCEAVSSLKENSKRLSSSQVQALEGLFAKRLNIGECTTSSTWLRKRLIVEHEVHEPVAEQVFVVDLIKEIESMLMLNSSCNLRKDLPVLGRCFYVPLCWQLQAGPSCGIAALNMAVKSAVKQGKTFPFLDVMDSTSGICQCVSRSDLAPECKTVRSVSPSICDPGRACSILEVAQKLDISNEGEMFCAYNLAYLSWVMLGAKLRVEEVDDAFPEHLVLSLLQGLPVLLAYDRSLADHKPGLYRGEHAHWVVVFGVVFLKNAPGEQTLSDNAICGLGIDGDGDFAVRSYTLPMRGYLTMECGRLQSRAEAFASLEFQRNIFAFDSKIALICAHGMSQRPFLCSAECLVRSNAQLISNTSKFIKSSEDLHHLRGKVIFFESAFV